MSTITLPQARIPLGYAMVQGVRVPVEIDMEWMRVMMDLVTRTGGTSGDTNFSEYLPQFFDTPHTDATAAEAIRAVDELRNELASAKTEQQVLRSMLDQISALLETQPASDLRNRIEQIEGRLM